MPKQKKISPAKKSKTKKSAYGWVPDLPDHRDIMYSAVRKIPAKLPPAVDLRPMCSKVQDQGQLGSCTGNALVGALNFGKEGQSSLYRIEQIVHILQ